MPRVINLANLQQFAAINVLSDPGYDPSNHVIPNCAQITINWVTASLKGAHNVLHGSYQGAFHGSQSEANAIHTALTSGANWSALAAFINNQAGIAGVSIRDLNQENQPIITSNTSGVLGTSASPALPDEVSLVGTSRTAFTGPAHRGRLYLPGWATNALGTGNVAAAAAVTAYGNWLAIIAGALSGSGYVFCIGHPHRLAYTGVSGRQHPERPAGTVPITSIAVRDNHWDSQRRRGLK